MATKKPTTKKAPAKPVKKAISKPVKQAKKTAAKDQKKLGRPTLYKPEYDEMIVEHMKTGRSLVSFAAKIGVAKDTVYEWINTIDSFSDAASRARSFCQAWWEDQAVENLKDITEYQGGSERFNDRLWRFNISCRFRDDWTEKKTVTLETSTEKDKSLLEQLIAKTDGK